MRILRLLLINRKNISGLDYIDIDFSHDKHVILGSNGSGKSNLLSEMSALPPDANLYGSEGQKSIWFELDNGDVVEFTSYPNQKKHHCVYLNDDTTRNVNVSGTITEQRELAKRFTGITQVYFDYFVLGKQSFTATKAAFRRTIFDDLNTASYDYALGVHAKIKGDIRDNVAVLKHLTKRLTTLELERVDDARLKEMEDALTLVSEELDGWYALRVKDRRSVTEIKRDAAKAAKDVAPYVTSLCKRFDKLVDTLATPSDVKEALAVINAQTASVREHIDRLNSELAKRKNALRYDSKSKQALLENIAKLEAAMEAHDRNTKHTRYSEYVSNLEELPNYQDFEKSLQLVVSALQSLPNDKTLQYDRKATDQAKEDLRGLNTSLASLERQSREFQAALDHFKSHADKDKATCPNCKTMFVPFINELDSAGIEAELKEVKALIDSVSNQKGELELAIMDAENYFDLRRFAAENIRAVPTISDWWLSHGISLEAPIAATASLNAFNDTIINERVKRANATELCGLKAQLSLYDEMDAVREDELRKEVSSVDGELDSFNDRLHLLTENTNVLAKYGRCLNERLSHIKAVEKTLSTLESLQLELRVSAMADFIDEHLRNLSARRGQLFTAVQAARTNDDNIAKVKKEMIEKEALLADLQVLERALSPLNGVIAEGMFGFITAFIELMNTYIGGHWHDPLTVMPCKLNETGIELDYLFPVQTLREMPNDISECSSGQKEIIDWAFREAGMLGLGLSTHPVLFDEWGVRMDEAHKNKTCELLGDLTERSNHDQVIIVSHLKMVHDALGDVRQLVLCDRNISISGNYNDHAILK